MGNKLYILILLFIFGCSVIKLKKMKINLNFETEYNQFYITNGSSVMKERTNDIWEDSSFKNRIYVEKGFIAVRTASYGNINLEVKLLKEKVILIHMMVLIMLLKVILKFLIQNYK